MARRYQFSIGALLGMTTAVATLLWLAQLIGLCNISMMMVRRSRISDADRSRSFAMWLLVTKAGAGRITASADD